MKKFLIASSIFSVLSVAAYAQVPANIPNTQPNLTQENPTTNNNAYSQPSIYGPQVVPNPNVGNPGMVDDQDAIFKKNDQGD